MHFSCIRTVFAALCLCAAAMLCSCERSTIVSTLEEDELFSLGYGSFEDQLNLFSIAEVGDICTSLAMRDGFFYIANGESKKIMEMTSYGDLLRLYYNYDYNPTPSFLSTEVVASSTRKAIIYPFNRIGAIAVDERQYLYAVDELPEERQEVDPTGGAVLRNIVLRFDADGAFLDYLGQEGPGGTPFPYIDTIYATNNNELVVISRTSHARIVYWFSTKGYLLFTMTIDEHSVPDPYEAEGGDGWLTLENIVPDYSERKLYVTATYYESIIDEASRVQSGIRYKATLLHTLSVSDGTYSAPITVPPYSENVAEGFSSERYDIPYDFLGVTESGWLFFLVSTGSGFSVQMIQPDGQRILKRNLAANPQQLLFYDFSLSNSGILSMLRVQDDGASVVWWRTDSLIQAVLAN